MKTIKIGDKIEFAQHDGMATKTIEKILWSGNGTFDILYSKDEILQDAKEWCIILFDNGEWMEGKSLPKSTNLHPLFDNILKPFMP